VPEGDWRGWVMMVVWALMVVQVRGSGRYLVRLEVRQYVVMLLVRPCLSAMFAAASVRWNLARERLT